MSDWLINISFPLLLEYFYSEQSSDLWAYLKEFDYIKMLTNLRHKNTWKIVPVISKNLNIDIFLNEWLKYEHRVKQI